MLHLVGDEVDDEVEADDEADDEVVVDLYKIHVRMEIIVVICMMEHVELL
ncbi:MAG: hypothetical protein LBG52_03820 [Candidatus Peribacteria bacterium]|nr:hypothetical protein [Candidatus Peribacteria bacterium]